LHVVACVLLDLCNIEIFVMVILH